jgi:hypothetical protein
MWEVLTRDAVALTVEVVRVARVSVQLVLSVLLKLEVVAVQDVSPCLSRGRLIPRRQNRVERVSPSCTSTTRRALEDLTAHGLLARSKQGKGKADLWQVTDWARERWQATVPHKSFDMQKEN